MLLVIYNASDDPINKSQNGNIERKKIVQIGWVKMVMKQPGSDKEGLFVYLLYLLDGLFVAFGLMTLGSRP